MRSWITNATSSRCWLKKISVEVPEWRGVGCNGAWSKPQAPAPAFKENLMSTASTVNRGFTVALGVSVAAALFALTACDSGSRGGNTAASTTTSSVARPASASPTPNQDDKLALQMLDAIVRGDFATATAQFDSLMREKLTAEQLRSDWGTYQEALGNYQSHGDPQDVLRGDLTVVNIPLQMAREPGQFRVTFHKDATVAGLFFLKTGVPVP
jgi:Protein of unknown function (DUF3887)